MIKKDIFLEKFKLLFDETDPKLINFQTKFKDLEEWNSLIILSLIVLCEEDFKISISPNQIENSKTVNDLIDSLDRNLS
jgi:acyl carrier protein